MNDISNKTVTYYLEKGLILEAFHTGSRVICDPPPTDTDDDYIVLCDFENLEKMEKELVKNKWIRGGSMHTELSPSPYEGNKVDRNSVFSSWKKIPRFASPSSHDLNLILTISPEFFNNFKLATNLAKRLNLLNKDDRISVFNAVCYDQWPE